MDGISTYFTHVNCMACGHQTEPSLLQEKCEECGSHWLKAQYDFATVASLWPDALYGRDQNLWRYWELLPVDRKYCVTMNEGWSPILKADRWGSELGHGYLYLKDERQSPTSSFKDRQAAMAVSGMRASGITEAVLASTGNAAAAYAAYCARGGIKLWIFVTSLVPVEKMREATLYGAEVIKVTGTYDQAKEVASEFASRRGLHMEHGAKAIVGKESMKALAFEIAEQFNWEIPDWYIQAVSGGIGPVGAWMGFTELYEMGLIDRLPRMGIVQVEGCSPMVQAFQAGKEVADPVIPRTAITVLATGDPGQAYTLLYHATKDHGGTMIAVSDAEAFDTMRRVARLEGVSVEPATAAAFAGVEKMIREGIIQPDHKVVINASGHTMPVEKFILGDQQTLDISVTSPLSEKWGMPEEGLSAALEHLDEKITTVVVIDDSPRDSRLIRRLLHRHKAYRVFEANTACEGIDLVRERLPDLVVLDLTMPDMDGFDVLNELKCSPETANIPAIIVSGKTLSQAEEEWLQEQSVSFWLKGNYRTTDLVQYIVEQVGDELDLSDMTPEAEARLADQPDGDAEMPVDADAYMILIVDDNPLDGRLVKRTLQQRTHCNIKEAVTGEQALAIMAADPPDLIILDLMLPDMTGFDVLRQVRQNPKTQDIPIVVLTAKELSGEEKALLEQSVDFTLTKGSVDQSMLQEHVFKAIKGTK